MAWHLAQINVGRLIAPAHDPRIADFVNALDRINALADASPGFVWRLQTDAGDATDVRISDDDQVIVNLSVWTSLETLSAYVFDSDHRDVLRRRREWFEPYGSASYALWWVPAEHVPSVDEAVERLDALDRAGPGPFAFTFQQAFPPPEGTGSLP